MLQVMITNGIGPTPGQEFKPSGIYPSGEQFYYFGLSRFIIVNQQPEIRAETRQYGMNARREIIQ